MKALCLLAVLIILPFSIALAQPVDCFKYYEFQKGIVFNNLHPEKITYSAGDKLIAGYKLCSTMKAPITEGKVRVQIFYNDAKENEQMIDEFFVSDKVALFQNDCLNQEFSWMVPAGAKAGRYTLKTYFSTADFFNLGGISFLAYGPPGVPAQMTHFNVNNAAPSRIYLSKARTSMNDRPYAFGTYAPIREINDTISIKTFLINEGPSKQVSLEIKTYYWDDLTETPIDPYTITNTITLGSNVNTDVTYGLPALPKGAYVVKLIATSGTEKTEMKLRFAVPGEKARFEYAGITSFPLKAEQPTTLFFCVANSADYHSFFEGRVVAKVTDKSGTILFEKTFDNLSITPDPDIGQAVDFTPTKGSTKLTLTVEAYGMDGTLMDSVEIPYDYSNFPNPQADLKLNLNTTQAKGGESVGYDIAYTDGNGNGLDGRLLIYVTNSSGNVVRTIKGVEIQGSTDGGLDLATEGNYTVTVRELRRDLKAEENFEIISGNFFAPAESTTYLYAAIALAAVVIIAGAVIFIRKRQSSSLAAGASMVLIIISAGFLAGSMPVQAAAVDFSTLFSNLNSVSLSSLSSISPYGGAYTSSAPSNDTAHAQPNITAIGENGVAIGPGRIGVNIYSNPLVVDSTGDVIAVSASSDKQCSNETAEVVDDDLTGEWFKKGGPVDSPPVEWVDNLDDVKAQINAGTYKTQLYAATICSWKKHKEAQTGPSKCVVLGNLICSNNCTKVWDNATSQNTLNVDCSIDCLFFIDRVNKVYSGDIFGSVVVDCQTNQTYGIDDELMGLSGLAGFSKNSDMSQICASANSVTILEGKGPVKLQDFYGAVALSGEEIPDITYSLNVNVSQASKAAEAPKLEIKSTYYDTNTTPGEAQTIRVVIKNTGESTAKLDDLKFNIPVTVLYAPKTLEPGQESEILVEASVPSEGQLNLTLDYRAETTGCNIVAIYSAGDKIANINVQNVTCLSNTVCSGKLSGASEATCCGGFCRDTSKGSCQDIDGDGVYESWIRN